MDELLSTKALKWLLENGFADADHEERMKLIDVAKQKYPKIHGVLIDAITKTAMVKDVDDELDAYYELLGCHTIDIVSRKIGGKYFDIICDDEGLFSEDIVVTMIDKQMNPMLVGNLFICSHDGEGNTIGISEEDISTIVRSFRYGLLLGDY